MTLSAMSGPSQSAIQSAATRKGTGPAGDAGAGGTSRGAAVSAPQSAAAAMIAGKGRLKAKIARKAAPARPQADRLVSALRAIFTSACSTITITAALMPVNPARTSGRSPWAA